ncbi:MAG TPA: DUF5668 domain-containing protein [Mucilaginibacter sp.]|nr:DUF5668 domain-containing protein [Mucilaginibacter sp.]
MKTICENKSSSQKSRAIFGTILFVAGFVLLVDQLNLFFIPGWVFSWPMLLIVIGLYVGAKHNFRNLSWIVLVLLGAGFLFDTVLPGLMISNFIWPAGIIALGIYILMRNGHNRRQKEEGIK